MKTIRLLIQQLPDNKSVHQYLAKQRWADGVIDCTHCGNETVYVFKNGMTYKCKACRKQFSATTGTVMENTKLPLVDWILAMYLLAHKKGISSIQLAKDLGITQKSAWKMLHKIRESMVEANPHKLSGTVEIDEAFIGGASRFKHKKKRIKYKPGRMWNDKTPVLGIIQRGGSVRAMVVPDVLMINIYKHVLKNVEGGSDIMGDGFAGYRSLEKFYNVQCVDHSAGWFVDGDCHTNTIEGFWSQLKKQLKATHHFVSPKHLQKYLNEACFKYNNRNLDMQCQIEKIINNMMLLKKSA